MNRPHSRLLPALCIALLLLGQAGAALHAFEHDAGAPQGKPCSSCLAASQLGTAAVDCHSAHTLQPAGSPLPALDFATPETVPAVGVGIRGPPRSS